MSENRRDLDPDELELNKVAYLSVYERDPATGKPLTQDKVGQRLGITREQVNRLVQQARRRGILRSEYVPPNQEMLDRIVLELNYTDVVTVLQAFAARHQATNEGRTIQSVAVVCDELQAGRADSWDESLLRFGPLTAMKTKQFIRQAAMLPSPTIGLAWGRIIRCTVDGVSANDFQDLRDRLVQCIPLWGEAWGPEIPEWKGTVFTDRDRLSSSTLARDLEAKLNRREERRRRHSLEAVPIMLPREMSEHKELLFQYLEKVSAWGEVFGTHRSGVTGKRRKGAKTLPLVKQMQLVLGGAGSPVIPGRFLSPEVLKNVLSDEDTNRLLQIVYGDVAGVLMEKPNLGRADRKLLDEMHASWTGIREEHLRGCAKKAQTGKAPGVVIYAVHKHRALPVLEGIRRGLITHLVTDMGLAAELKRLAEQDMP